MLMYPTYFRIVIIQKEFNKSNDPILLRWEIHKHSKIFDQKGYLREWGE